MTDNLKITFESDVAIETSYAVFEVLTGHYAGVRAAEPFVSEEELKWFMSGKTGDGLPRSEACKVIAQNVSADEAIKLVQAGKHRFEGLFKEVKAFVGKHPV